jgi:transcriptional regulator with XRE-family HTH domain
MRGADVREWRLAHGLTQNQLAGLLGVWPAQVSRWERGENQPAGKLLELALEALDRRLQEGHA